MESGVWRSTNEMVAKVVALRNGYTISTEFELKINGKWTRYSEIEVDGGWVMSMRHTQAPIGGFAQWLTVISENDDVKSSLARDLGPWMC